MKYAIIENGKVKNIAEADSALGDNWVQAVGQASKGWSYDGQDFTPPPPPTPLTAEEIEAQVQEAASEILEGQDDKIFALAAGVVDLVIAARDGQIAGLSKPQVRRAFKRRIADNLRNRQGG